MEVFADEGITGTSTSKRKNFLRMIRQCRRGKIDLILTKSISALQRNTVDTLNYTRGSCGIWYSGHLRGAWPQLHLPGKRVPHHHLRRAGAGGERVHILPCQVGRSAVHAGDGRASIQYKYLLGYRKGADGQMEIVPEEGDRPSDLSDVSGRTASPKYPDEPLCPRDAGTPSVRRSGPPAISKPS